MSLELTPFRIDRPAGTIAGWTYGSETAGLAPVLFVHPINLAGACWHEVVTRLEPQRYCLMPDLRGHGSSDAKGPFGLERWAEDCFAALDAFGIDREIANPNDVDTVFEIWKQTISADAGPLAANVRCPVLVVNGELDKTCTPEQGAEMAEALSTEPLSMPGIGHLPMMEAPEQTAELVTRFLAEVDARAGSREEAVRG
jgi:pimeloyl-ACP methyl ester carboxylesterase